MSTETKPITGMKIKTYQVFLGKYITFFPISMCQALVVTLGNIFFLHVYVSSPLLFILFSIFISMVFTMIIYTLVSVLGNIGKALTMILLVLQISASGGTFPIQVTPMFFQIISPFLPFTYAVGGILWPLFIKDTLILLLYFMFFITMGFTWKRIFKNLNGKFTIKFKESGLGN